MMMQASLARCYYVPDDCLCSDAGYRRRDWPKELLVSEKSIAQEREESPRSPKYEGRYGIRGQRLRDLLLPLL